MLTFAEEQRVAIQFGVAVEQVRRDHLISHLLGALSRDFSQDVLFFGGTALSRTVLPDGRLSEDIDLIALGRRQQIAERMERLLLQAVRREFPDLQWLPALTEVRDTQPAVITTSAGATVRVQLLNRTGYPAWPTERQHIVQRYSDAPAAELIVPTTPAFVAWKTAAWADRKASRDLYDLKLLADQGAVTEDAAELFRRFGPTNRYPSGALFTDPPNEATWQRELSAQTRLTVTAAEALRNVRESWASIVRMA
ncbi:nucleotidyl transferase AbiEii/AbiGii toxin family protein [Nocardia cyriacigeorgica]|uniref:nucleotidyl transferase AbiEii/AbiGii toxin family protein n=1 Tax=Nocardia cyriacigeorgica TaxID=135487 RepID=UPI0018951152|nr:nucleotidyl transferase AbiEii/AbiGii toxin family protein [Nocardia cyriacigeorgica]MBF6082019.1 nucleotidyl transferase AbiEii/AbiGii toxin family protein [Nocardia cyriacigeorgica]MBF6426154.1 nucleotidyl transferase AbiEii/AbiGii toxin family protein [Nocardia cyriacigeorgica]